MNGKDKGRRRKSKQEATIVIPARNDDDKEEEEEEDWDGNHDDSEKWLYLVNMDRVC